MLQFYAIFLTVASLFFRQWQLSSLAVGTSSGSGSTITGSGNALCILFPTEFSREQVYWLPAAEIANQSSTPAKPVAPFVHTRPVKSDVHKKVWKIKECITAFEKIVKERTAPPPSILSSYRLWHHTKECFDEQITPFFNNIKQLFQTLDTNSFQELKEQLQGRDDSIRNLQAQNDIMSLLNVGSTNDSYKQALETELTQFKDTVTSLKIQNDGYKVTNANLNRCYEELSKANTYLRTTSLEKIAAQKAEIATLNAKTVSNKTSGTTKPANPKVIASGMYAISPKKLPAKSAKGEKVEEHIRNLNKKNRVDSHVKHSVSIKNLNAICGACHDV
nr:hypothetical protein [Tanacetum cinerariifolium]